MRLFVCLFLAACVFGQNEDLERARRLLATGQASEAASIYRRLASSEPGNADLLVNLSIAEYKAGRFRDSAQAAKSALTLQPGLLPARLFLGASYLELGDFHNAIDSLARVVAINPKERNGRLMLAEALLGAGRAKDAEEHLVAASEMIPDNPRVWSGLGRMYETLGRKEAAAQAWKRLMELPPSLESHLHSAEMHRAEHRWREETNELREAVKLAPANVQIRIALAWSLFRSRDYEQAMATLKGLTSSDNADISFLYGASLLNLQKPAEAMPYLQAAIARDPKHLPARAALGQCLLLMGKPEEAAPLLQGSLSLDEDGSIHFQLFRAYQMMNRKAEAQQALAAYQRLRASLAGAP